MSTVSAGRRRWSPPQLGHLHLGRPHLRRPRLTPRRLAALAVLVLLLAGGWLWFRSSSLVAVRQVEVTGLSGEDVGAIRATLVQEARTMTTLDISTAKLEDAVSGYRHIAGVSVSTGFPHRVTIDVDERIPVATVRSDGHVVAVDGAGLLLPGQSTAALPSLSAATDTAGARVNAPSTLGVLDVLGAAPYQLLSHISGAQTTSAHGIVVSLSDGPQLYFGSTAQLARKWGAVIAALANTNSEGAGYIDVSAPGRPAAGT